MICSHFDLFELVSVDIYLRFMSCVDLLVNYTCIFHLYFRQHHYHSLRLHSCRCMYMCACTSVSLLYLFSNFGIPLLCSSFDLFGQSYVVHLYIFAINYIAHSHAFTELEYFWNIFMFLQFYLTNLNCMYDTFDKF